MFHSFSRRRQASKWLSTMLLMLLITTPTIIRTATKGLISPSREGGLSFGALRDESAKLVTGCLLRGKHIAGSQRCKRNGSTIGGTFNFGELARNWFLRQNQKVLVVYKRRRKCRYSIWQGLFPRVKAEGRWSLALSIISQLQSTSSIPSLPVTIGTS